MKDLIETMRVLCDRLPKDDVLRSYYARDELEAARAALGAVEVREYEALKAGPLSLLESIAYVCKNMGLTQPGMKTIYDFCLYGGVRPEHSAMRPSDPHRVNECPSSVAERNATSVELEALRGKYGALRGEVARAINLLSLENTQATRRVLVRAMRMVRPVSTSDPVADQYDDAGVLVRPVVQVEGDQNAKD